MLFKKDRIIKIFNLGLVLLFVLLILKDPFSERTLIPNFEPYPDTFNYINPPLNFVKGKGFNMNREGRIIKPNVPPLYSFSLIPFFILRPDPRMAYFANVVTAFVSLFLFWLILRKIFTRKIIVYSLLILYITNYFIYWVPSLIMAENLALALFLVAFYFLLLKITTLNSIVIASLAVGIYATKFASIPTTATIILLFLAKISVAGLASKQKIKTVLIFLAAILSCYLVFALFEQITKGNNISSQIFGHLSSIAKPVTTSSWFGVQYLGKNLPLYLKSLIGQPNRFLWDNTPLVPSFVGIGAFFGIFSTLFNKKFRFISLSLLLFIATSVGFMSTFYSFDARYIYIAIPALMIGLGLFLSSIADKIGTDKKITLNLLTCVFICIYLISSFTRIKSQISLNLKYAETPWHYISVLKMNEYFTSDKIKNNKKPVLISALPPFLIDYYSNGNYTLLPLSYEQEYRGQEFRQRVWGDNDYSNLPKLYQKYLKEGFDLYVSRAGLGNESYTNRDFNTIVAEFDTKLVLSGCYNQCNIYSVQLKEKNAQ